MATYTPTSASASGSPPKKGPLVGTPTNVSEPAFEYLLSSMLHWVEEECEDNYDKSKSSHKSDEGLNDNKGNVETGVNMDDKENDQDKNNKNESSNGSDVTDTKVNDASQKEQKETERLVLVAENAAAKMERLGYDVGYRLAERLAQGKSMTPIIYANSKSNAPKKPTPAQVQLEAVKFICKEFWTEVFRKQVDKLQTNHRGVFVLKDLQFKWLKRLPEDVEIARVMAIKILAFPCGLVRGALANLGIVAVVSCDFLADGKNMSACSFNIKVKA